MADPAEALARLDTITRRLRVECPWDREQDERSIVPHTVEEAYELADAAHAGDVLFQVYFLSLLMEERGVGGLGQVADDLVSKLVRRHPHVFGDARADTGEEVRRTWDGVKAGAEGGGLFGDLPDTLPSTLYAKKAQRRGGRAPSAAETPPGVADATEALERAEGRECREHAAGELLFAAVAAATEAGADPELALRAAADRYVKRVQEAQTSQ